MGRRGRITAGERATLGVGIVAVTGALAWSDERRLAIAILLAVLAPYLAVYAPVRCGSSRTEAGPPCPALGHGLLLGCGRHRFNRLRRLARRPQPANRAPAAPSRLIDSAECTRAASVDLVIVGMLALATVAGWFTLLSA